MLFTLKIHSYYVYFKLHCLFEIRSFLCMAFILIIFGINNFFKLWHVLWKNYTLISSILFCLKNRFPYVFYFIDFFSASSDFSPNLIDKFVCNSITYMQCNVYTVSSTWIGGRWCFPYWMSCFLQEIYVTFR